MPDWLWTSLGLSLLAVSTFEVYATILQARKRPGPLSERLNAAIWWGATTIAFRLDRTRRHAILSAMGPLLLPILGMVLIANLIVGFGLIYLPRLPTEFVMTASKPPVWQDALYFSSVTLLTIGYGDITPHTAFLRFVSVLEGLSGIAILSLATAYLLTVYGAVERKRAAALAFFHQAGKGADVPGFIAHYFRRGRFIGFEEIVRVGARDLQVLMEAHIEHPVIHYFHSDMVAKSFPHMIFLLVETATIVRTCLDPTANVDVCDHPDLTTLGQNAQAVIDELAVVLQLEARAENPIGSAASDELRHARCFQRINCRLSAAGIVLREDASRAFVDYLGLVVTCVPKVPLWKACSFNALHCM